VQQFEGKVVNILKATEYMHFNDELPVILVEEQVVCRTRVEESVIREAVEKAFKMINNL
jgi:ribosomal protein L14